jgi:DNA-binding MarR family transcriptional regulator
MRHAKSTAEFLTSRLLILSNTLGLYSSRRYRDEFGVTLPEWRVLSIIAADEPTSAREVSRILATDKGWVSLSADKLKRRGYVVGTPDKRDGRRTLLTLTKEGRKVHDAVLAVAQRRQQRLVTSLPEGGFETLIACLERLQIEANRMLDEQPQVARPSAPTAGPKTSTDRKKTRPRG